MTLRFGQWCKFHVGRATLLFDPATGYATQVSVSDAQAITAECQKAVDGRCVGIYLGAGRDPLTAGTSPAHIVCVTPNGDNVRFAMDGRRILAALIDVDDLSGIEYLTSDGRADIPPARLFR